jgi:hypothetical protein
MGIHNNKMFKNKTPLIIFLIVVVGLIFLLQDGPLPSGCGSGDERCVQTDYQICQNKEFISQGEVPGFCGVDEEPNKNTYYRLENNVCSTISLFPSQKTGLDFETLDECEGKINKEIICKGEEVIGEINGLIIEYQQFVNGLVVRLKEGGSTTWVGIYDCETEGKKNADTTKAIGWINDEDYPELVLLLRNNPTCNC